MNEDIAARDRAFVRAVAAWGAMRHAMDQAQPGTTHDCWRSVGQSLCGIAASIEASRERSGTDARI